MLDLIPVLVGSPDVARGAEMWAASGAMALTGRRDGPPLLGPASAAPVMAALASRLSALTGGRVQVDGPALLGERAAIAGHGRQGAVSCGGSCRILRAADGWVALSLARETDEELVPAWIGVDGADAAAIEQAVRSSSARWLVERATLLGLPVAERGSVTSTALPAHSLGSAAPVVDLSGVTVVDLSSLWAGPLCTQLLVAAGARVIKVESTTRPDGARLGPRAFWDLMHAGKEPVTVDFRPARAAQQRTTELMASSRGHQFILSELIEAADVVVEASRPRALEQLGIDAWSSPARVWLSITGYGRDEPMRVAFGDDAAVAGGLMADDAAGPVFAADAAADPATGLLSAVAVLDRLAAGGRWLIDASLARTAALLAAAPVPSEPWRGPVAPPRARRPAPPDRTDPGGARRGRSRSNRLRPSR